MDSILFFYASTIKNMFNANNRQKKIDLIFQKVSKNVFSGYFAKAIAGENGPKIRYILLNLVYLGGIFLFQCNLSLACLGMLIFKSDRHE